MKPYDDLPIPSVPPGQLNDGGQDERTFVLDNKQRGELSGGVAVRL